MAFKGINPSAQSKFKIWHLSQRVVAEFLEGMTPLINASPTKLPVDQDGICFVIDVDDPQPHDDGYGYMFELRIRRNDDDFWIADIDCTAVTGENEIAWSSKIIKD
jgi:hypothetical protein